MADFLTVLKGKADIDDLKNVTIDNPGMGDMLVYDGTKWENTLVNVLALGETSSTAYRGDRGKTAYDHSQLTTGNPHNVTSSDVGLSNVTNDAQLKAADLDTDSTFAADSDTKIPSQKAVKTALSAKADAGAPRVASTASSATPTPDVDTTDHFILTAQAAAAAFANPTGTPASGQRLLIQIKDNATARALTWGTDYAARGADLPSTTTAGKWLTIGFIYNVTESTFDCVAVAEEA